MRFAIVAVCLGALGAAAGPLQAQEAHDHMGLPGGLQTQFHGFVDVTARTTSLNGDHSSFGLGQYDFFLTSRLAEHISFVGETVFEFDDDFVVDVERIIITFSPNRFFRVAAGKHHTPFGYWNNAYHHGTLFQPTIERPLPIRFEDDGGPFPVHTTGLLVSGRDISRFHLGYDVLVGNGIGSTPIQDNNTAKSYTLAVHSQVTSGLRVGASLYLDRIASETPSLGGAPLGEQVDQRMYGGFAAYLSETWEAIGEFYRSDNTTAGGRKTGSNAFFVYAGRRFGKLVSYLQYDEMDFAVGDPYYTIDDQRLGLIGARYDLAPTTGIKLELQRHKLASVGTFSQLMAQVSVGF
jgi:hypothetical protein